MLRNSENDDNNTPTSPDDRENTVFNANPNRNNI
jgi:hypothetical protein